MNKLFLLVASWSAMLALHAQGTQETPLIQVTPEATATETKPDKASGEKSPLHYSITIGHVLDRHTGTFEYTNIEGNGDVARSRQVNSTYQLGFGVRAGKFETIFAVNHSRPVVDFGFLELEDPFTYDYTLVDFGFEERYHVASWGANTAYISAGFGGSSTRSAYQNKGSRYVDLMEGNYVPDLGIWYSYGAGIQHAINEKHQIVVGLLGKNRLTDYELDPIDVVDPNQSQTLKFNSLGLYAALHIKL